MTETVVPGTLEGLEAIWERSDSEVPIEVGVAKDSISIRDIATILDGVFVPTSYVRGMRATIKDAERFAPVHLIDKCKDYALVTGLETFRLATYIYHNEIGEYIAGVIRTVGSLF